MSSKKNTKTDLMTIRRGSTTCNNPKQSQELQDVNSLPTIAFVNKSKHRFKALLEQMDKESNLTLNERFNIFVSETSFTALTKIFKAQNILKSMIWLILTLGMMTWLCIQCYSLFSKYFSYPYEVTIGRESVSQMEFPSVTICNRNPVKKSKYENSPFEHYNDTFKLSKNSLLFDKALAMMKNGSSPPSEENGGSSPEEDLVYMRKMIDQKFDVWQALNDSATAKQYYNTDDDEIVAAMTYSGIASEMQQQKLKSYGHQLEEFLVSCRFAGLPCSPTNFTYINNAKYGNCYTFNAFNNDKETLYSSYAGPMMGLALELNVQQNEYMPSLAPDAGVRALVHARGTYPAIEDDGFSIPVGTVTSVGVLTTKVRRLTPPHASCATIGAVENIYQNRYGTLYDKATCVKSCQQYIWKEKCGCVLALYAVPDNASVCDISDLVGLSCIRTQSTNMQECEIKCPNPCFETKYEPLISMGSWPSKEYEEFMDFKLTHMSLDYMSMDERPESDENMVKLEVYFRELVVENVEQQKSYESQNLISDVGGQLGLWLGLSAITIGEVIEFVIAIFKAVTTKVVRRNKKDTAVESF